MPAARTEIQVGLVGACPTKGMPYIDFVATHTHTHTHTHTMNDSAGHLPSVRLIPHKFKEPLRYLYPKDLILDIMSDPVGYQLLVGIILTIHTYVYTYLWFRCPLS